MDDEELERLLDSPESVNLFTDNVSSKKLNLKDFFYNL